MAKQIKFRTHTSRVKFDSIRDMAQAYSIDYMVLYMRLRKGMKINDAVKKPVRGYCKRNVNLPCNDVFGPVV